MNNSVFISYRRNVSSFIARAIFQDLRSNGIDTFMDVESINSGQFDTVILNQIAARPYFLLILTPGTLDRCVDPGDWLLREIEHALNLRRVIIPLTTSNFSFDDAKQFLQNPLANELPRFNTLRIPYELEYFDAAMERLRTRFLKPTDLSVTPTPPAEEAAVQEKLGQVAAEPAVTDKQLGAQDYFERALTRAENDLDGKIADYSEAIRLNPQDANAYYNRGLARQAKGELNWAIADYSEAIRLNPQYALAYNNRGAARKAKGDLNSAIADFNEAIRLNPSFTEAYNNRGNARQAKGDWDGAIADYTKSIEFKNPQLYRPYNNRGNAYQAKGDLNGAIADYTEALRLNPQSADAYKNRGFARITQADYDSALADFTEALRLNPQDSEAYYNRGNARKEGDQDGALADYTEALRLNPQYVDAYYSRGFVRTDKGDYDGALADYTEVIRLNPQDNDAYINRGEIYFEQGQYQLALQDFQTSDQLKPGNRYVMAGLAITLYALGQLPEAARLWQSLLVKDDRYHHADWVGQELNWAAPLVEAARKLIAEL